MRRRVPVPGPVPGVRKAVLRRTARRTRRACPACGPALDPTADRLLLCRPCELALHARMTRIADVEAHLARALGKCRAGSGRRTTTSCFPPWMGRLPGATPPHIGETLEGRQVRTSMHVDADRYVGYAPGGAAFTVAGDGTPIADVGAATSRIPGAGVRLDEQARREAHAQEPQSL